MDNLPKTVPLYGPEGVMFVKTDNPCTVAMQMRMYADLEDSYLNDPMGACRFRSSYTSSSLPLSYGDDVYDDLIGYVN